MRVTPSSHPFQHTGLDYAGPFTVTNDEKKRYILTFVCMATKAVHIELTVGMTVTDTMKSLRRFCARRGTPTALYSDNGPVLMVLGADWINSKTHFLNMPMSLNFALIWTIWEYNGT